MASALAVAATPGQAAAQRELPATGFDHAGHAGKLAAAKRDEIACARCHPLGAGARPGRPGHASCFDSRCHSPPPLPRTTRQRTAATPYSVDPGLRPLCKSCHSPTVIARVERGSSERLVAARERRSDHGVALTMPHDPHAAIACARCHPAESGGKASTAAPHTRCASCHRTRAGSGPAPAMTACADCHTGRSEADNPYRTVPLFSHRKHLPRARQGKDACIACHAPRAAHPDKASCARCHDGARAFSVTDEGCRRCHSAPAAAIPRARPATLRFLHREHQIKATDTACTACHTQDASGAVQARTGHAACSAAACHGADFGARSPAICGACHVGVEPWLELYADRAPPGDTEFGSQFSHSEHPAPAGDDATARCRGCHALTTAERELRLPRGHRACSGSGCHAATGGPAPELGACTKCHVAGLVTGQRGVREKRRWSVRSKFSHDGHLWEPGTQPPRPVVCTDCHRTVDKARSLADIAAPPKAACARCHDGAIAFKLTGHDCAKCHKTASLTRSRSSTRARESARSGLRSRAAGLPAATAE